MRRVVLSFWISLDGYSCDDGTELYRVLQGLPDDEQWDEYFVSRLRQAGDHIMGRATYEGMAEFWPTLDDPVARAMNEIPMFAGLDHPLPLRPVTSRTFPSGMLELVYSPS
jgi:dihydrofolate reductase